MKTPRWLGEFHRQWFAARKRRTDVATRAFRRAWQDLLDDAGISKAEDRKAAFREAEALEREQRVHFVGPRRENHSDLKLVLPVEQEAWLHELFGTQPGADAQQQSLVLVQRFAEKTHPIIADSWKSFIARLSDAIVATQSLGPFSWREPERLEELLSQLLALTSREWPNGTLIRDASTALFNDSKLLERQQAALERALSVLFERDSPLEALGIQTSNSVLYFSGPLTLHLEDGSTHDSDRLRFESTLSLAELMRATRLTTTAKRILTVENRKTTFLQIARADAVRDTLIIATSFPTQAVRRVLELLPADLSHHHFGDTDPSGWDILRSLRAVTSRPVMPFLMPWRPGENGTGLSQRDQQLLARLLADERMSDCSEPMTAMKQADTRGLFEQEMLGPPTIQGWPFYEAATSASCAASR